MNRHRGVQPMANAATNSADEVAQTLASIHTESGANLLGLTEASPVLLIFLRHFGCSFCRQAISDVAELKGELDKRGVRPVFVHLGKPERAKPFFDYYGIGDVERVSDPEARVYQLPMFALPRMHPALTLIQPSVWVGWLKGAIFKHGIGAIKEDGHQMQGIFFLGDRRLCGSFAIRRLRMNRII
jgi:peroxiredoxin